MSTATAPPLPQVLPAVRRNDFADWLSPILVKELRQGLKTRIFVSTFIVIQVVMLLLFGLQLLDYSSVGSARTSSTQTFDGFFWALLWIPLLLLMPARGIVAVSEEVRANTLDLVQMTKLSSFRIIFGKWIALVSQTVLIVAAILPYAVLRYFFGKVDIVQDLQIIASMLAMSVTLTAGAIALSGMHLVVRILVLIASFPFLFGMFGMFSAVRMYGGIISSSSVPVSLWLYAGMVVFITAAYSYLFLELAASKIAPPAKNHAVRIRLLALGIGIFMLLPILTTPVELAGPWCASLIPLWLCVVIVSICDRTIHLPPLYRPFAKRGFLGRLAGRFFYPGWASGVWFTLLLTALLTGLLWLLIQKDPPRDFVPEEFSFYVGLVLTSILTPVLILRLFPKIKQPLWLYVLVQGLFGLIFLIAQIVAEGTGASGSAAYPLLSIFPLPALFAVMDGGSSNSIYALYSSVTMVACFIILATLMILVWREFRRIRTYEKDSLGTTAEIKP